MKANLCEIKDGSYNLNSNWLYFGDLTIDKESALEIMATLLDSENLLTKEAEDLIAEIDERVQERKKLL